VNGPREPVLEAPQVARSEDAGSVRFVERNPACGEQLEQ
jgi:hypothetical protein